MTTPRLDLRWWALALALGVAVWVNVGCVAWRAYAPTQGPARAPVVQRPLYEDERGWDCRTMGNGDCGPNTDTTDPEWVGRYAVEYGDIRPDGELN